MTDNHKPVAHLRRALKEVEAEVETEWIPDDYTAGARSQASTTHHALEVGLKGVLRASGVSERATRGHNLLPLLEMVQQHRGKEFDDIVRCFETSIDLCDSNTGMARRDITDIFDYLRSDFNSDTYEANKYWSIENSDETGGGAIAIVTREIVLALIAILSGERPQDAHGRIEDELRKSIVVERGLDRPWDTDEWLAPGSLRERLEVIEGVEDNKVLRAAVRRCHRETKDLTVRYWAMAIRNRLLNSKSSRFVERRERAGIASDPLRCIAYGVAKRFRS